MDPSHLRLTENSNNKNGAVSTTHADEHTAMSVVTLYFYSVTIASTAVHWLLRGQPKNNQKTTQTSKKRTGTTKKRPFERTHKNKQKINNEEKQQKNREKNPAELLRLTHRGANSDDRSRESGTPLRLSLKTAT